MHPFSASGSSVCLSVTRLLGSSSPIQCEETYATSFLRTKQPQQESAPLLVMVTPWWCARPAAQRTRGSAELLGCCTASLSVLLLSQLAVLPETCPPPTRWPLVTPLAISKLIGLPHAPSSGPHSFLPFCSSAFRLPRYPYLFTRHGISQAPGRLCQVSFQVDSPFSSASQAAFSFHRPCGTRCNLHGLGLGQGSSSAQRHRCFRLPLLASALPDADPVTPSPDPSRLCLLSSLDSMSLTLPRCTPSPRLPSRQATTRRRRSWRTSSCAFVRTPWPARR